MPFRRLLPLSLTICAVTISATSAQNDLVSLASSDANQFVSEVQRALKDGGIYKGAVTSMLDQETISAINVACAAANVLSVCQLGPLSTKGSAAVAQAIGALRAEEAAPSATPPPPEGVASADAIDAGSTAGQQADANETLQSRAAPVAWRTSSARNGIEIAVEPRDGKSVASITGTAASASDWTNITAEVMFDAASGQFWSFSFHASADLSDGAKATGRIAAYGGGRYLGELSRTGAAIEAGEARAYVVTGEAPHGTEKIVPYIQVQYPEGSQVDGEIAISDATVAGGS